MKITKTPKEITAFLATRRRAFKDGISTLAKEVGCTCYYEYIRILNKHIITAVDADKVLTYISDLLKATRYCRDINTRNTRAALYRYASQLTIFLF